MRVLFNLIAIIPALGCGEELKQSFPVGFYFNVQNQEYHAELLEAMELWNSTLSEVSSHYGIGPIFGYIKDSDKFDLNWSNGFNLIYWHETIQTSDWIGRAFSHEINEDVPFVFNYCDILINGPYMQELTKDLRMIVYLHELGHCIGLPHTLDPRSVMYPELSPRATITYWDIQAFIKVLEKSRSRDEN